MRWTHVLLIVLVLLAAVDAKGKKKSKAKEKAKCEMEYQFIDYVSFYKVKESFDMDTSAHADFDECLTRFTTDEKEKELACAHCWPELVTGVFGTEADFTTKNLFNTFPGFSNILASGFVRTPYCGTRAFQPFDSNYHGSNAEARCSSSRSVDGGEVAKEVKKMYPDHWAAGIHRAAEKKRAKNEQKREERRRARALAAAGDRSLLECENDNDAVTDLEENFELVEEIGLSTTFTSSQSAVWLQASATFGICHENSVNTYCKFVIGADGGAVIEDIEAVEVPSCADGGLHDVVLKIQTLGFYNADEFTPVEHAYGVLASCNKDVQYKCTSNGQEASLTTHGYICASSTNPDTGEKIPCPS